MDDNPRPRPMTSKFLHIVFACALLETASVASAQEFKAGDIVISKPWSRATPKGAQVGAGYLVIENRGTMPDRLLGGSVEAATSFEIHDVVVEDGVMRMRELKEIELPPGGSVEAKPGGRHIMFVGLLHPLAAGEKARGALQFEHAGRVEVEFEVIGMGAPPPGGRGG
ncbi:copper chaperone PCu(A)C [Bradyrhizobium sp.]|uniref:copper chaperone PCu(A)C n=1 Tax=Bradyrhizobium sp. TaxID=376 RepID=UPI002BE3829C|nr:copper chaperone PCu(A)C [Bradyrhizobium sp.]HWX63174.1 copper chaperone PCu(A)C [Bradyrhizobium sp.]